jgi:hypothetical protein
MSTRLTVAVAKEILGRRAGAIEANPATPGEIVVWCVFGGVPIYSASAARELRADIDAAAADDWEAKR